MTYEEALQPPKRGWKHANDEQMLAVLSEWLGNACCLRPDTVFD
jgi:hypothetical protein